MDRRGEHWVGTWTTAPAPVEGMTLAGQTLRMITHVSIGGSRLRVRLSNAYGPSPLEMGGVHVALRSDGPKTIPGTDRIVKFSGAECAVIPAGALLLSDPIELDVPPLADLAVSIYLPQDLPESFQVTGHGNAHQTNYISSPGQFLAEHELPVDRTTEGFLFLTGVEVLAPAEVGGVVAFGDSLTDGNISPLDANARWPDELARQIVARRNGRQLGVMNEGFGGNRILFDTRAESGLRRFDRDVLAQPGVTHVIVLLGINDIRNRNQLPEEEVTAEQMIAGLYQLAVRGQTNGLRMIGGTLLTFEHETFNPGFYSPEGEAKRQAVNAWIRTSGVFDAVVDFEKALRDPSHPTGMLPRYDCGDHLHPSAEGYLRMGQIIDLSLLD
jgi:lysophospholipase L1-like esterase